MLYDLIHGNKARNKRFACWRAVAQRHGGDWVTKETVNSSCRDAGILVTLQGVEVFVDEHEVYSGASKGPVYTRAWARYPSGEGPSYQIYPQEFFDTVTKLFGAQDLELGSHAAFDKHFVVKGEDLDRLKKVFTVEAQAMLLKQFPQATLYSEGEELQLKLLGTIDRAEQFETLLQLMAFLGDI